MGQLIDLNSTIPASRIDPAIATDAETAAAINAHLAATDPHSQYLVQAEGDTRYEYRAGQASKQIAGPLSFPANVWTSLGTFAGFPAGVQGAPSAIAVAISFCFDTASPWQQACCAALLGPAWWQPALVADAGTRVFLEVHNVSGFFVNIRFGRFSQDLRELQILPETALSISSAGRVDATLKRFI